MLFKKSIRLFESVLGPFVIGVKEVDILSPDKRDPGISCRTDTCIFLNNIFDVIGIELLIFFTDLAAVVGRSVIDKNDLYIFLKSDCLIQNGFHRLLKIFFNFINGYNNRKLKLKIFHLILCFISNELYIVYVLLCHSFSFFSRP